MLVIPEDTQEYFREVHKIASDRGIVDKLDKALLYAHLYACDWVDPERARSGAQVCGALLGASESHVV